jgi:hypothetical protein
MELIWQKQGRVRIRAARHRNLRRRSLLRRVRGPGAAQIHVLPTLWFRNTWSDGEGGPKSSVWANRGAIVASHPKLGEYTLQCEGGSVLLFTENKTNDQRLWRHPNPTPFVKDGFYEYVVSGNGNAVNPAMTGTKAAAHYVLDIPRGGSKAVCLRLRAKPTGDAFAKFDEILTARLADANEFYDLITPKNLSEDERRVHRQALAGMLWSKRYHYFDLDKWLLEHDPHPVPGTGTSRARNAEWFHVLNKDVIFMPTEWWPR